MKTFGQVALFVAAIGFLSWIILTTSWWFASAVKTTQCEKEHDVYECKMFALPTVVGSDGN